MPKPVSIEKAYFQAIEWNAAGVAEPKPKGNKLYVQFNPETLKVNFANQVSGQDNNGGSATQYASRGTTKLTLELWFDVSNQPGLAKKHSDVRMYTKDILVFMNSTPSSDENTTERPPAGCRFQWGTFLFDGTMDSINENLEYFSEDGVPLRASLSVSITKQELKITISGNNADASGVGDTGTRSMQLSQQNVPVGQQVARNNDVDNLRNPGEGRYLRL